MNLVYLRVVSLRVVSSAYIIKFNFWLALTKSLIYIINNSGPRTKPCGTPVEILSMSDLASSISTYGFLSVR